MKNPTQMMRSILTSEKAQEIIDYVSPIYGESYVGLWIYQAIGSVLDQASNIAEQLLLETTPETTTLLISYWEAQYGIQPDTSLTIQQRRNRILAIIQSGTACNPAILASAVSAALNGAAVEVIENVAKNTFRVNVRDYVENIGPAIAVLNRMKPAHLIYQMQVATMTTATADIKLAAAVTHGVHYDIEVDTDYTPVGVYQVQNTLVVLFGVTATQTGGELKIS